MFLFLCLFSVYFLYDHGKYDAHQSLERAFGKFHLCKALSYPLSPNTFVTFYRLPLIHRANFTKLCQSLTNLLYHLPDCYR